MIARAASVATLFTVCSAQLIYMPLEELKALAEAEPKNDVKVGSGFVHPKICDPNVNQTAGYIKAASSTDYFFWLTESRSDPAKDPLIMWLSGGPGCSSQLALLFENGPCSISKDGHSTIPNNYSWNNNANVMWVDQPAGVGFSTGFGTHNEDGVASNMFTFLQGFFTQFEQYRNTDFFIFGESYAGHYVPAIAHRVWQGNQNKEGLHIPMKGIAIGNGLTNPEEQYKWYAQMGYDGGKEQGGHAPGVWPAAVKDTIDVGMPACIEAIKGCNAAGPIVGAPVCFAAAEACNILTLIPYKATGKNPYDERIPCEHGNLCYDMDMIGTYLNTKEVQTELGVNAHWFSCNMAVNLAFQLGGDWMHDFSHVIPDLLHDSIEVLVYAGDCDFICNWLGNKAWTKSLNWSKTEDFNKAEDKDWQLDGKTVARLRSADSFHFMQVFEAGHMVPMDQPAVSVAMVNAFISGTLAENTEQPEGIVV